MSLVRDAPSSPHWTVQHCGYGCDHPSVAVTCSETDTPGTPLFVALLDFFGTSFGVLPDVHTIMCESTHVHFPSSSCDTGPPLQQARRIA